MADAFRTKTREWIPVPTNQIRLRHLRQICIRRLTLSPPPLSNSLLIYFTLHVTTMSSPFYTSECLSGENIDWGDIDARKFPEDIVSSCPGVVVRIWVKEGSEEATPCLITTWGIYFTGLDYIGTQLPKEVSIFEQNTVIFSMSWGYFTAKTSLNTEPVNPEPRVQEAPTGKSYNLATMCRIHRLQRAIYKEAVESERLRQDIQGVQTNPYRYQQRKSRSLSNALVTSPSDYAAIAEMQVKRQEILYTVNMLQQERNRQLKKVELFKETLKNLKSENHARSQQLKENYFQLQADTDKLSDLIKDVAVLEDQVWRVNQQLISRRRQLFQELAFIFPIVQIKEKVYTINGIVLPDSDGFAGCDDNQLSVGLGYVAHLVHMISVFIQVPNRYPITVYSSMSRITDLITRKETDVPKEFPLYAKGKDRLHFEYGVYLLNKNIAQLRWLFGMSTTNLAATLPNLASLMLHLTTPPLNEEKKVMKASETGLPRTGSASGSLYRYKSSKWQPQRVSSLTGSQISLAGDQSASTLSLDRLPDSPQTGAYFRRAPENAASAATASTLSLDLAVDRPAFHRSRVELIQKHSLHGSAPDLTSPKTPEPSIIPSAPNAKAEPPSAAPRDERADSLSSQAARIETLIQSADTAVGAEPSDEAESKPEKSQIEAKESVTCPEIDSLFIDDEISSVSARTEALAISAGTFKMSRRGQSTSLQGNG